MKIQLAAVGIVAALGLAACETTSNTNMNRASTNANTGTVVNSNSTGSNANSISPITSTNSNTTSNTNSNRSSINYNGTAKENESSRSTIESEAKQAGRTIGTGANDWWLWGKTRAALAAENDLRDSTINVDVSNDIVTLTGSVSNKEQVTKADKVAKGITGVKSVNNKLTVNANGATTTNTNSNANVKAPAKKG